ncbi:hypothetical protein OE88DRAFT_1639605 [Heliocybe sulcata]|uniref:Uncharacterized protein n=1 Tax=Heliocybe sulcata TaxID=5364 RepID=A0A5C3MNP0_9AGAM|nr:hypothetical protein OE88DRAFT_1639605 [Heliocybe sulcata]
MYSVAGSKFLASLGIRDFPTFGLVTDGSLGAVSCTYTQPPKQRQKLICEANAHIFDISNPVGAFNFCIFLSMLLTVHGPELERLLTDSRSEDNRRAAFQAKCKANDPALEWNMIMQRKARAASVSASSE